MVSSTAKIGYTNLFVIRIVSYGTKRGGEGHSEFYIPDLHEKNLSTTIIYIIHVENRTNTNRLTIIYKFFIIHIEYIDN